jgi:arsenite methyltransferase
MTASEPDLIRAAVRDRYAKAAVAVGDKGCCGPSGTSPGIFGQTLYEPGDAAEVPADALTASLGCGNPTMLADLRGGEVVLDLGSGGGIDVFLSARRVGPTGKAYGLDMTPEMLDLARRNQAQAGITNAEFLQGTIEDIPLPSGTVDVVISNCVVNLSPDKDAVLRETFRVLKPGGRLAISDVVLRRPLSEATTRLIGLWTGCISGALVAGDYEAKLRAAGFEDVSIEPSHIYEEADLTALATDLVDDADLADLIGGVDRERLMLELVGAVMSAFVRARKPTP